MATTAGQMSTAPDAHPQWVFANGAVINGYQILPVAPFPPRPATPPSTGTYRDWVLRMGFNRTQGIGGFWIKLPTGAPGAWLITTADDNTDATAGIIFDARNPPPGVK
jgi:hypothetical protein